MKDLLDQYGKGLFKGIVMGQMVITQTFLVVHILKWSPHNRGCFRSVDCPQRCFMIPKTDDKSRCSTAGELKYLGENYNNMVGHTAHRCIPQTSQ